MTDWRALCAELAHEVEQYAEDRGDLMPECAERARAALAAEPVGEWPTGDAAVEAAAELIYSQAMKWAATQPIPSDHINIPAWQQGGNSDAQEVARRTARAALAAKPLVKGPTDEELKSAYWKAYQDSSMRSSEACWLAGLRAVARYGHQPAPPAEGDDVGDEARYWVKELRDQADELSPSIELFGLIHRAADLLEQRHPAPVPVAVPEGREPASVVGEPSDEELALIYHDCCRGCEFMDQGGFEDAARAVLARWGRPAPAPVEGEVAELALKELERTMVLLMPVTGHKKIKRFDTIRAALKRLHELENKADLSPAPPAPKPADGEVAELAVFLRGCADDHHGHGRRQFTRAAELLEQFAPVPVPVSERLPGPEDCDAEGRVWWLGVDTWMLRNYVLIDGTAIPLGTHWLAAHDLPLPSGEAQP